MKTPVFIQTILDAASLSGRHVAGLRGDFRSRLAAFRRNRAASEQAALEEDFSLVLAAWGIADADIPGVISLHRPVCSAWSRRSGAFPFCVTVALRRCAAGCCVSASVRSGQGVSLLTLIIKGVASCFPEPY